MIHLYMLGGIMKKFLILLTLLMLATPARADRINQVVFLNTTIPEAEETLLNTIKFYEGKVQLIEADKEKHIYVAQYNMFNTLGLYPTNGISTNVNVNLNSNTQTNSNNNIPNRTQYAYGGYSCQLKQLNNGKDVLCTCRKFCYAQDYIYSHYKKYYREMQLNGKQVVKYSKYLKGKYIRL